MNNFIFLGDNGSGEKTQYEVSKSMEKIITKDKIKYIVGLGDNIYNYGVESLEDPQFYLKFEKPYENIDKKFYMCLGNHDYDYITDKNTIKNNKSYFQIKYTLKSKKWHMPHKYYEFCKGNIQFVVCDTNLDFYTKNEINKQINFIINTFNKTKKSIKILTGHHTWVSIGGHGRALPLLDNFFKKIFDECKGLNIYMCGHDHCKTHIIKRYKNKDIHLFICGTGGESNLDKVYNMKFLNKSEKLEYYSYTLGVGVFKENNKEVSIQFYDTNLNLEYKYKISNN